MDFHHDQFDGDEEAALRYAIALSLQDANVSAHPSTSENPIELDSDGSEDNDLENGPKCPPTPKKSARVLAEESVDEAASTTTRAAPFPQAASQGVQTGGFAALGLDRKRMEEERLARAAKRKAPPDIESTERHPRRVKLDSHTDAMPLATTSHASTAASPILPYPKGIVKKTVCIIPMYRGPRSWRLISDEQSLIDLPNAYL